MDRLGRLGRIDDGLQWLGTDLSLLSRFWGLGKAEGARKLYPFDARKEMVSGACLWLPKVSVS